MANHSREGLLMLRYLITFMLLACGTARAQDCSAYYSVIAPMVTTWDLTTDDAAGKTITLPLRTGFAYDFVVDWGDGTTATVTAFDDADISHEYASTGTKTVSMTGTLEAWYFNDGGDKLKFKTVESWGSVRFTGLGLAGAFHGCANATSFADLLYMPVTSLASAWGYCSSLTTAPDVNALVLVDTLYATWYGCSSLTTAPDVNALVLVDTLYATWRGCTSLTTAPDVNTLVLVDMLRSTWHNCSSLTTAPDVSALVLVDTLRSAWYDCSSLTVAPDVNTLVLVNTLRFAWYSCSSLTVAPVFMLSSSELTNVELAFYGVGAGMGGTVVELWDTSNFPNISSFANAFTGATGLTNYADIPDAWKGL